MTYIYKSKEGQQIIASFSKLDKAPEGFTLLEPNTVDAAKEKHVPVVDVQRDGHIIHVVVGETPHPMTEEHLIEWIAFESDDRFEVHYLKPGQVPATFFAGGVKNGTVYAYCNLHGLWKATF
ncbi:MAG: desulfoferrodoxin family protein [Coriobacteriaceae bacterium]|nr:desulfoferrodoxin family protein [Coriobacteriaceae bacterium]